MRLGPRDAGVHNARMLPSDFQWIPHTQHQSGPPRALALDGVTVAIMLDRIDGTWAARLEAHRPVTAPLVVRPCSSFEAGRRGCELWAARHCDRLREEVARIPRLGKR